MEQILVGVITHAGHKQFRDAFFSSLEQISYPQLDWCFVTNSGEEDAEDLRQRAKKLRGDVAVFVTKMPAQKFDVLAQNRNRVREYFLKGTWTHMLFLDSDMLFPPNIAEALLANNAPFVSGVYLMFFEGETGTQVLPVMFLWQKEKLVRPALIQALIPRTFEAAIVGFGCALIARELIEKISFKTYTESGKIEDTAFCYELKEKLNIVPLVDANVRCKHLKHPVGDDRNKFLDPDSYAVHMKKK